MVNVNMNLVNGLKTLSEEELTILLMAAASNGLDGVVTTLLSYSRPMNSQARAIINNYFKPGVELQTILMIALAKLNNNNVYVPQKMRENFDLVQRGLTALMHAAKEGHRDIVVQLIAAENNASRQDSHGRRVSLMLAAKNGHGKVVSYLMSVAKQTKMDINFPDTNGKTALSYALSGNFPEIAHSLLSMGAVIKSETDKQNLVKVCFKAFDIGRIDLLPVLVGKGYILNLGYGKYNETLLMRAAKEGNHKLFNYFVSIGGNQLLVGNDGRNAKSVLLDSAVLPVSSGSLNPRAANMRTSVTQESGDSRFAMHEAPPLYANFR